MKNQFRYQGFTLVELLLVVTILGILAAIAVPKLFPQTERARVAEAIAILQSIRQGEVAYFLEHDTYHDCSSTGTGATENACWAVLGMDNPNPGRYFSYKVVAEAPGSAGPTSTFEATATRKSGVEDPGGKFSGKQITLDQNGDYGTGAGIHPFSPT